MKLEVGCWAMVLVFSACSQSPGPRDASTSAPDPVTAYCEARAAADCAWGRRCGTVSESACPAQVDCAREARPLLRAGALSFDADAGADCVAVRAAQPCDFAVLKEIPARCADVFVGTGGEGEACGTCAAGLGCSYSNGTDCGRCIPRSTQSALPGLGEECTSVIVDGSGCAVGFGCAIDAGSRGVCEPYAQLGEVCDRRPCAMGLNCKPADGGVRCRAFAELGQACSQGFDCKQGLRCVAGACTAQLAQGESCSTWEDCASMRCVGGTCAALFVGLGDSCADALCAPELRCSASRVCVWPLPPLAACSDQICEAGSSCEQGVCTNRALTCQ